MGFVDCHFHVIAPQSRFPMHAGRSYTPAPASLDAWRTTMAPWGVTHGVLVQPSVYGTDNRALLATLAEAPGQLVGVAAVDGEAGDAELDGLAAAGVRGIRLAHFDAGDPRARGGFVPWSAFDRLEPRLAARGMHLQLFTDSRLLPALAPRLLAARVPVVIDHMGRAPAALGAAHAGVRTLVRLMREGPVWVKLSGLANVSDQGPGYEDVRAVHEVLLAAAPDRLVWGSDWPHTAQTTRRPDTAGLLQRFRDWTPPAQQARIGIDNARRLYGF